MSFDLLYFTSKTTGKYEHFFLLTNAQHKDKLSEQQCQAEIGVDRGAKAAKRSAE